MLPCGYVTMTQQPSTNEKAYHVDYPKVFLYGFFSVLTFGAFPSYLRRMAPPRVAMPNVDNYAFSTGAVDDFAQIAQDIADATRKACNSHEA